MLGYLLRRSIIAIVAAVCLGIVVRLQLLPSDNAFSSAGLKCLFVMAHPDDESMFFAPTILYMVDKGLALNLLYVTTGNSEGHGEIRRRELTRAVDRLGVSFNDTIVMNMPEFEDGTQEWDTEQLALIVQAYATERNCNCIVTFDEWGISKHPNHIDCMRATVVAMRASPNSQLPQVYVLESVSLWRKYISLLDLLFCDDAIPRHLIINVNPFRVYRAMWEHKSQLLWFRYLYMLSSRYVWINTLIRINESE